MEWEDSMPRFQVQQERLRDRLGTSTMGEGTEQDSTCADNYLASPLKPEHGCCMSW